MSQQSVNRRALVDYLESQGWRYETVKDDGGMYVAKLGMNLKNKLRSVQMFCSADDTHIQSFAISPISASEDAYDSVVDFITRANYGLKQGNFEFDHRDGEVRYQSALVSIDGVPTHANVERVVDIPFLMFQKYGDGLVKVLMGYGDPEQEIRLIEG